MTPPEPIASELPALPRKLGAQFLFLLVAGVLLPAAALLIELTSGMAADFFDPVPSWGHILAIVSVGLANVAGLWRVYGQAPRWLRDDWLVPWLAIASGIAFVYACGFLPIAPFAVIAIIAFGLGLLPLSPALALVVAGILGSWIAKAHPPGRRPAFYRMAWFAAGLALMLLLELPGLAQAWATAALDSPAAGTRVRALAILRQLGEDRLLRACYFRNDDVRRDCYRVLFGMPGRSAPETAFYRATGRTYQSLPRPSSTPYLPGAAGSRQWSWDWAQGGAEVGERQAGLFLQQSRLEGYAYGDAATGYVEWTMVFRNENNFGQQEARALVQLPPGAVVSRLTLWIGGEEREAAFGGSGQVRQAYQAVVSRRRDPVLVTMKGPDRVLVQCFPVEPRGEMKIRLGLSVPLVIDAPEAARLALPQLLARNFEYAGALNHAVWLESDRALALSAAGGTPVPAGKLAWAVQAAIPPARFEAEATTALVERDPAAVLAWTADPTDKQRVIRQQVARQPPLAGPLTIVIDGSRDLETAAGALADVLEKKSEGDLVRLLVAGDTVREFPEGSPPAAAAWLREQEFTGGQDATAALEQAVAGLAAQGGALLWIHGAQPLMWTDSGGVEQAFARRRNAFRLFAFPAVPGTNVLLEKIAAASRPVVGSRLGDLRTDLTRMLEQVRQGRVVVLRERVARQDFLAAGAEATSHLARLWAAEEVERLAARGPGSREAALALATRMQLVTSVSGAVVLETKQQYDAAGLAPVDPKTVPSVPDQASTLLLLAAGLAITILVARSLTSRRATGTARAC